MITIIVLISLLITASGAIWFAAYRMGKQNAIASDNETAKRIADVPVTGDDTVILDELRDGKRKL